jgi:hypothetical protein
VTIVPTSAEKKAIINRISDLDTIRFKASQDTTIAKITLERYGDSSIDDIAEIRLEDQDGNIMTNKQTFSKDKIALTLKKDYRLINMIHDNGILKATIVVKLI